MAEQPTGKLAVILHADVVGSTVLVQRDERRAHERITNAFRRFSQTIQDYGGHVHEIRGDALVAEFSRASDAVCAAIVFQRENTAHNETLDDEIIPEVRIGVSLGEVVFADNTVTGAGVVLAQRVEQLAEPGGMCVTEAIREATPGRLNLDIESLGEQALKGFEHLVYVHAVRLTSGAEIPPPEPQQAPNRLRARAVATAVAAALVVAIALAWLRPWQSDTEFASVDRMAYALPSEPSIVVLPFNNLSGESEQDFLADGFTESVTTELSRFRNLFVIARNSTISYQDKPMNPKQVSEELGVQYVLEGSVQRSMDRVRVNVQLIDAITGRHLWGERYDKELNDIFAVQDEITGQIVASLATEDGRLAKAWQERTARKGTESLSAYELALRGGKAYGAWTKEAFVRAEELLEKAIAADPSYARPYANLALITVYQVYSKFLPKESLERAVELAQEAIARDDGEAWGHWALGAAYLKLGSHDRAVAAYERALELNPNDADVLVESAWLLAYVGRAKEGVENATRAMRLNPRYPDWYLWALGVASYDAQRYDEAVTALENRKHPNLKSNLYLAAAYSQLGRQKEAQATVKKILADNPESSIERWGKTQPYQNEAALNHYIDGLRKAGLPEKPPLALPDKPSIAVLPFTNLTGDLEQDYFVDGFTNEIITNLSKFPEFFVIASNSVFTYKDKAVRVNEIGRELGVRYVLEGSLQRSSNNISVHAQLVEAASEKHLWAESYEGKPEEIFAVQRDLTRQISSTLASKVINLAHAAVLKKNETSLPAYELYLKGAKYQFGKESFEESIRLLERAVELDPDFTAAYARLANRYLQLWRQRLADDPDEALRRARDAIHKALTLDQQDYRVRLFLANLYQWADKDHDLALAEYEKALALNPNQADVMGMISLNMAFAGRAQEAVDWIEKAKRLNPHHPIWYDWNGSFGYYMARQYDKALLGAKRTLTVYPKSISVLRILAATYVEMGNMEKARGVAQKVLEIDPEFKLSNVLNVPLKREADRERYFGALAKAGLPE